jgi:hypothetical protein
MLLCAAAVALISFLHKPGPSGGSDRAASPGVSTLATSPHVDSLEDPDKRDLWIVISQDAVRKRLKDPDSAKFEDVFFSTFEGHAVVCGRVNSKSGFGGYTGSQGFIASGDLITVLEEEMAPGEFGRSWGLFCTHRRRKAR